MVSGTGSMSLQLQWRLWKSWLVTLAKAAISDRPDATFRPVQHSFHPPLQCTGKFYEVGDKPRELFCGLNSDLQSPS